MQAESTPVVPFFKIFSCLAECLAAIGQRMRNWPKVLRVWMVARIQLMLVLLCYAGETAMNMVAGDRELPRREVVNQVS
jgi:hypothetical protein